MRYKIIYTSVIENFNFIFYIFCISFISFNTMSITTGLNVLYLFLWSKDLSLSFRKFISGVVPRATNMSV